MRRLLNWNRIPQGYNRQALAEVIRPLEDQVNRLSEGRVSARYGAATAAPTTGIWARGDIVWNSEPSAAGYIGFVCVTAGEPGTWKGFGVIQS
jgi:hypothetical protein